MQVADKYLELTQHPELIGKCKLQLLLRFHLQLGLSLRKHAAEDVRKEEPLFTDDRNTN